MRHLKPLAITVGALVAAAIVAVSAAVIEATRDLARSALPDAPVRRDPKTAAPRPRPIRRHTPRLPSGASPTDWSPPRGSQPGPEPPRGRWVQTHRRATRTGPPPIGGRSRSVPRLPGRCLRGPGATGPTIRPGRPAGLDD
jgi:hypothetical protein